MNAAPLRGVWLLLLLLGCGRQAGAPEAEAAPGFELEKLEGGALSLAELRGRMVLLDFWATWCPPCVLEIPELNAVYEAGRRDGFTIVAVSVDEDPPEELRAWVAEHDVHYPVVRGDMDLARAYRAFQFPYHVLIDGEGRIVERLPPGFHDREELGALLERHGPG